jgi:hypothetical protein
MAGGQDDRRARVLECRSDRMKQECRSAGVLESRSDRIKGRRSAGAGTQECRIMNA